MSLSAAKKQLFSAAEEGDLSALQAALAAGAPVNTRDADGRAPLHMAAAGGHTEAVRALLAAGAQTERRRAEDERTALHIAAEEGHVETVSALLDGGADVEALDVDGGTPLHCAAHFGDLPVIQLLLKAGAKVRVRNYAGLTALLVAAEASSCRWVGRAGSDYPAAVTALLEAAKAEAREGPGLEEDEVQDGSEGGGGGGGGASGNAAVGLLGHGCETDGAGEGASHAAVRAGAQQVVAALCRAASAVAAVVASRSGLTALHLAAAAGQLDSVRHLVAAGALLEARETEGGLTALHAAVQSGQEEAVEQLLAAGADPGAPDTRGLTPLHTAVQSGGSGAVRMVRLLLGPGAGPAGTAARGAGASAGACSLVNANNNTQRLTPLHLAAAAAVTPSAAAVAAGAAAGVGRAEEAQAHGEGEASDVVRMLLAAGADAGAADVCGRTALHVAATRGNITALRVLLEVPGATELAARRDSSGRTARQMAEAVGHAHVAVLLPADLDAATILEDNVGGKVAAADPSTSGGAPVRLAD